MALRFIRRWWWWLPAAVLLIGLGRLRFDVEILNLLPADLPVVQGLQLYQEHFADTRELILTIEASDAARAEDAARSLAESLRQQSQLVRDVTWQAPGREDPEAVAEFLAYLWLNQPEETVNTLVERLRPESLRSTLDEAREELATALSPMTLARLSYDPLGLTAVPDWDLPMGPGNPDQELFVSADGRFRVVFVEGPSSLTDYQHCASWLEEIRRLVTEWQTRWTQEHAPDLPPGEGVAIHFTGQPAFMAEIGGGMERDLVRTVTGMFLVIGVLFGLTHRTWIPLQKLLVMLGLVLAGTLALGGLLFGELNVVSVGFAAMLLALAVDYGLVLYQESKISPGADAATLRSTLSSGIWWAALTTAGAFMAASLAHLPGLVQMGTLVGAGILLSAAAMLYLYLPWILRSPSQPSGENGPALSCGPDSTPNAAVRLRYVATAVSLAGALGILAFGLPDVDQGTEALRPVDSQAYATLAELKHRLGRGEEPTWLIVAADDDNAMIERLNAVHTALRDSVEQGVLAGFTLPQGVWPHPERQALNRPALAAALPDRATLVQWARDAGFTERAVALADHMGEAWRSAAQGRQLWLPTGRVGQWALGRLSDRSGSPCFALGLIHPQPGSPLSETFKGAFNDPGRTWITSWDELGVTLLHQVERDLWIILPIVTAVILITLSCTFRRRTEILLSLAALGLSLLILEAIMKLAGWSWNLMNVVALPVLLGTGVDYGIHMQLALRRHQGNWAIAHRGVGKALLLCGATTIAGFGSLVVSSNAGLASLGRICATGMAVTVLTTVFLLPAWWSRCTPPSGARLGKRRPSRLYRAEVWKAGLTVGRHMPIPWMRWLGRATAELFWLLGRDRRAVVLHNLGPACASPAQARACGRRLYHQFAQKLVDLWLYESGRDIDYLFGELRGADLFRAAQQSGRGILLVTPHLGNWEMGGPVMARHGIRLLALTLAEPHEPLTELRIQARARHGIETLVIQKDPFAFLEVVRRLERGENVALLIDRPPTTVATTVTLFGRSIAASLAPAELARASGCLILPVHLLKGTNGRYDASVLQPIEYDRSALRAPEKKRELAQEIQRAFEPVIRQHADQWYHFVPIWSEDPGRPDGSDASDRLGATGPA